MTDDLELPPTPADDTPDVRLYVVEPDWQAHVKPTSERMYCYLKNPHEDFFHLILAGEIYLEFNDEKLCLRCAFRRGVVTQDRLHWQNSNKKRPLFP